MKLYLIRHAEAAPQGDHQEDEERPLTDKGWQQGRDLASGLGRHGVRFDRVLASPLLRARQTAEEMLSHGPQPAPELRICEELAPGSKKRRLVQFLREQDGQAVALVGHEPDLSAFAAWMIGSKKTRLALQKAGVVCLECDGPPGKGDAWLVWLISPDWLV